MGVKSDGVDIKGVGNRIRHKLVQKVRESSRAAEAEANRKIEYDGDTTMTLAQFSMVSASLSLIILFKHYYVSHVHNTSTITCSVCRFLSFLSDHIRFFFPTILRVKDEANDLLCFSKQSFLVDYSQPHC